MAGNLVPEQPRPKGSEQPTRRAPEGQQPAEKQPGPAEQGIARRIDQSGNPDQTLEDVAGSKQSSPQHPDTIGGMYESMYPGGTQPGGPASEGNIGGKDTVRDIHEAMYPGSTDKPEPDQPNITGQAAGLGRRPDTVEQIYEAVHPGSTSPADVNSEPIVTTGRDTIKDIHEAVIPGSTTERPEAAAATPAFQELPRTGIAEVDTYLDRLRNGEFQGYTRDFSKMLEGLSSRMESGGDDIDVLAVARSEICDRSSALATVRNARSDFDRIRGHGFGSEYINVTWSTGENIGAGSVKIGYARDPIEQIANLRAYFEGDEWKQVQEKLGDRAPNVESRIRLYMGEMGRQVAEDRRLSTDQVTEVLDTLRKGDIPLDGYKTSDGINQRLAQIESAQSASPDLAGDSGLQAERNDLITTRDEINDRYSSLGTRRNAQRDIDEIRSGRSRSIGISVTHTVEGQLTGNSLLLGGNNSLEDRLAAIQKAREDPKYQGILQKLPDFDRRVDEYIDEFKKAMTAPPTPQ